MHSGNAAGKISEVMKEFGLPLSFTEYGLWFREMLKTKPNGFEMRQAYELERGVPDDF